MNGYVIVAAAAGISDRGACISLFTYKEPENHLNKLCVFLKNSSYRQELFVLNGFSAESRKPMMLLVFCVLHARVDGLRRFFYVFLSRIRSSSKPSVCTRRRSVNSQKLMSCLRILFASLPCHGKSPSKRIVTVCIKPSMAQLWRDREHLSTKKCL